ncbi:hypothetical protein FCH28_26590 [Streptomyces piniterrae]|uniref:Secreted protein n=1 Tax=Streptomyces piniterrae TaxID=2571125 RepID=A0A4U0N8Q1_9ACTN|nr:hypothetical protein [Streptomyces piniterrae]TJZ46094.1 hypothetical protein FCH28_26590 [Streptomyces piniterrae]
MRHVRRSYATTLLLLLAVTFGPLLCRTGGDQAQPAGRSTETARTALSSQTPDAALTASSRQNPDAPSTATSRQTPEAVDPAAAGVPKKCQGRHAPAPDESVPPPTPHRGEPLAPDATGPAPLATDAPAQFALARPPTGSAPATDPTALRPVLRI